MKNRSNPGGFVPRECIKPAGLTITEVAEALGVNGKRGISPEMAVRLSKEFGGEAQTWLIQQAQYDLAQVRVNLREH
jgi:addiction module HigA family antidote